MPERISSCVFLAGVSGSCKRIWPMGLHNSVRVFAAYNLLQGSSDKQTRARGLQKSAKAVAARDLRPLCKYRCLYVLRRSASPCKSVFPKGFHNFSKGSCCLQPAAGVCRPLQAYSGQDVFKNRAGAFATRGLKRFFKYLCVRVLRGSADPRKSICLMGFHNL